MDEYIKRRALLEMYEMDDPVLNEFGHVPLPVIRQNILDAPAADVAPVVHGRWIDRSDKGVISMTHPYFCNRCGRVEMLKEPYCNCGARMDG